LDLCSHPTLPTSDRVYSQQDDDIDEDGGDNDGDTASLSSSQVICLVTFDIRGRFFHRELN